MAKTVVLMRHGKAQAPTQDQQDMDRCLTEAGAQALEARLPSMLGLLEAGDEPAQLWTSPAARAQQTAALLRKALRDKGVRVKKPKAHDCLWEQYVDGFIDDLANTKANTVFAVCHAPFVEDVVERLVGSTPPFSTGAIACLEVDFDSTHTLETLTLMPRSRLLWFAQGPVAQRWKTLAQMQAALTRAADDVDRRRDAFFADPTDIETMHKFRVSIRTLRSLVAFAKPWQEPSQNAQTQALLKEIVGHTSRQRELDVFEEQALANESSSPELLAFCKREAAAERKRVIKAISSKRLTKSLRRALRLAKNVTWRDDLVAGGLAQKDVRRKFDAMVASITADLDDLRIADEERTHDVRKRAKRVRYAAERFSATLGDDAVGIAKGMTAHQNNLGAVCDARVNIALIADFLKRDLPDAVAWDLALLRAQNETFLYQALKAEEAQQTSAPEEQGVLEAQQTNAPEEQGAPEA